MSKFLRLLFLSLALLSGLTMGGQDFAEQLSIAERIKEQYGETDDRYLEALYETVWTACREGYFEDADILCHMHLGIIAGKYGENSLAYAEDLWILGQTGHVLEDPFELYYLHHAAEIYEGNNAQAEYPYCDLMWELYQHYYDFEEWDKAEDYLKRHISLCETWMDREWKGFSLSYMDLAHRYMLLGALYEFKIKDLQASNNAFEESVALIEKYELVEEYEYSDVPYQGLALNNYDLGNYEEATQWQLRYTDVLRDIFLMYCDLRDHVKLIEYAPMLLNAFETMGETETVDYWETLRVLILSYINEDDFQTAYSLFDGFERLTDTLDLKSSGEYWHYLLHKSRALCSLYKIDEYEKTFKELETLTNTTYANDVQRDFLMVCEAIANNNLLLNDGETKRWVDRFYQIVDSDTNVFFDETDRLRTMGWLHEIEGRLYSHSDPRLAEEKYLLAIDELGKIGVEDDFNLLTGFAELYEMRGNYEEAIVYYGKARETLLRSEKFNLTTYGTILTRLAYCYDNLGKRSVVISILEHDLQIVEDKHGKTHPLYGEIEAEMVGYYLVFEDYRSAISCCEKAVECFEQSYGNKSERYFYGLLQLANLYTSVGNFSQAKDLINKVLDECDSPNVCDSAHGLLLSVCFASGDFDKGFELAGEYESRLQENGFIGGLDFFNLYCSIGISLAYGGDDRAGEFIEKAISAFEAVQTGRDLLEFNMYFSLMTVSGRVCAEDYIQFVLNAYRDDYFGDLVFLNGDEREAMMANSPIYSNTRSIIFSLRQSGKYDTELYDFLLFNKGLLLGTSIGYAKAVYDSGEEELVRKYETLLNLRRYINGEPVSLDGEYTTEKAKTEATAIEREITLYLRQNGGYTGGLDCSYEDVRNALGKHEIAVEFVEYKDHTDNTEYYAALLAKKEWSKPKYVRLCKKDDLDKLVGQSPDKLYCESFVSQTAYNLIWASLEPYFDLVKTVYFSPAGHINRMAVESLYNGEQRFNEAYNVVRLTSTREICNKKSQQSYASAVLYGGLTYEEDDDTLIAESRNVTGDVSGFRERFRGFTDGVTRKGWNYLPGTLEEVNKISSVLADATINYDLYSSEKGNEESFKALSGTEFNILHIATHGFYMTETQAERSDFFSSYAMPRPSFGSFGTSSIDAQPLTMSFTTSPFSAGISPLQRSGLILSGGNRVWTGQTIPDGVEDGILTAAEVANLDFAWCDVVVLSACETGLGEITDEGVFGLQRAFKNAGVNTIIMSLWEVDDAATSLMMQTFYKNLVSGKSKRESFLTAQEKVREQYPDPRYWAAFIMLD